MAEHRYNTAYTRAERNVMWTIAFVILLLVLIVWGIWYFSRPSVTTGELAAGTVEAGTVTGSETGQEARTGVANEQATGTSASSPGSSTTQAGGSQY